MLHPINHNPTENESDNKYNTISFLANENLSVTYQDWAKHHKYIGSCARRRHVNENGEIIVKTTEIESLNERLTDKENYGSAREHIYESANDKRVPTVCDYVIYSNQHYPKAIEQKPDIDQNTTVQLGIRLNFLLDDFLFHLDYRPRILGQYNILDLLEDLGEIIYDIADREDIERYGITVTEYSEEDEPEYDIFGVRLQKTDDSLHPSYSFASINVTEDELIEGFVGCELYQYDIIESDEVLDDDLAHHY